MPVPPRRMEEAADARDAERVRVENSLSEEDVAALSSSLVEAKQEETQAKAQADALVGGAVFDEEETEEEEEETTRRSVRGNGRRTEEIQLADESANLRRIRRTKKRFANPRTTDSTRARRGGSRRCS